MIFEEKNHPEKCNSTHICNIRVKNKWLFYDVQVGNFLAYTF